MLLIVARESAERKLCEGLYFSHSMFPSTLIIPVSGGANSQNTHYFSHNSKLGRDEFST